MNTLLVLDQKNYDESLPIDERFCVRAVIVRNGKLAVQKSRYGDYKILGGGMERNENVEEALSREVMEEAGLIVKKDTIRCLGEILEKRRDLYDAQVIYLNHTWFYYCEVEEEIREAQMTSSELARGYHLAWASPDEIIKGNEKFLHQPWILRDTRFVEILKKDYKEILK